jgi:hypothetical protein
MHRDMELADMELADMELADMEFADMELALLAHMCSVGRRRADPTAACEPGGMAESERGERHVAEPGMMHR